MLKENKTRILEATVEETISKDLSALKRIPDLALVNAFSFDGTVRAARVSSVVDGDTVWLVMMHENRPARFRVRLLGIDTPEMRPPRACAERDEIKKEAVRAKEALTSQLRAVGNIVHVHCHQFGKYGRILVTLYTPTGVNLNEWLIDNGYAVRASVGRIAWSEMWPQLQKKRNEGGTEKETTNNTGRALCPSERQPRTNAWRRRWNRVVHHFGCCCCRASP